MEDLRSISKTKVEKQRILSQRLSTQLKHLSRQRFADAPFLPLFRMVCPRPPGRLV